MLARGIAITAVGFPATSIDTTRARFCMSASHSSVFLSGQLSLLGPFTRGCCMFVMVCVNCLSSLSPPQGKGGGGIFKRGFMGFASFRAKLEGEASVLV